MTKGILAFGAYIPWRRLPRKAIAETHGWFNPALKGQAKGERAFCNWDEDPVTMAVEAARDALAGRDRGTIGALHNLGLAGQHTAFAACLLAGRPQLELWIVFACGLALIPLELRRRLLAGPPLTREETARV